MPSNAAIRLERLFDMRGFSQKSDGNSNNSFKYVRKRPFVRQISQSCKANNHIRSLRLKPDCRSPKSATDLVSSNSSAAIRLCALPSKAPKITQTIAKAPKAKYNSVSIIYLPPFPFGVGGLTAKLLKKRLKSSLGIKYSRRTRYALSRPSLM